MAAGDISGWVFDFDHYAVHDGPGIRTCVYLKGCPLKCSWCHSPESQNPGPELLFIRARCTLCGVCAAACPLGLHRVGETEHSFAREGCTLCGRCEAACSSNALVTSGRRMTVADAAREAAADRVFFAGSGGGVTLSGGEVLFQPRFAADLARLLRQENIHVLVETTGYGAARDLLSLADYTDCFYFDYKLACAASFACYTGGKLTVVDENLRRLREKTGNIVLRVPLIPDVTDTAENISRIYETAAELRIKELHLLAYNGMAAAKYEWCGREYFVEDLEPRLGLFDELLALAPPGLRVVPVS